MPKVRNLPYQDIIEIQNFFFRNMAITCLERKGIFASSMGINNHFLNAVYDTQLDADMLESVFPEVSAFFKAQEIPWSWIVTPFTQPSDLGARLEEKDFKYNDEFIVMGMESLDSLPYLRLPDGLRLHEVAKNQDFVDWILPLKEGFGSNDKDADRFRSLTESIPFGGSNAFHHYILYQDGEPVAGGTFSILRGDARLDNIAVLPKKQRQGLGTLITLFMLYEVKKLGIRRCFLDSSKEGVGVYKKLGFQEYYMGRTYSLV